jgi:GDPmannose 4,6-dehydratase
MKALVTGAAGQDGSYLTEYLAELGYEVYGLVRPRETCNGIVIEADVATAQDLPEVDEIYHLAAQSHVGSSFKDPYETMRSNVLGTLNLLEHARKTKAKFYQASTSELFGSTPPPQDENTVMHPRSPYGISKQAGYWMAINYREAYGLDTYNGILFNHESPRRGQGFVTQKICQGIAAIKTGQQDKLKLGNIFAQRDWGHAKDYIKAMHLMVQHEPGEYVVATGETRTVKEFIEIAFDIAGLDWQTHVVIDPEFYRPAEVDALRGDASKIRALGWEPEYSFYDLVKEMVISAIQSAERSAQAA